MTTTDLAARLRQAATLIRQHAAAIKAPLPEQTWHTEPCADEDRGECACIVAQGTYRVGGAPPVPVFYVADAETPELAAYIALMHPGVGEALAAVFDQWAWMAEKAPDLLHRVGGPETLAVADALLGEATR